MIVEGLNKLYSFDVWGRVGRGFGFGNYYVGYSIIGESDEMCDVYQRRKGRNGKIIVKYRYTVPPDPKTERQMFNRGIFRDLINVYKYDPQLIKDKFFNLFEYSRLNAQQRLVQEYHKEKPTWLGLCIVGESRLGHLHNLEYFDTN